MKKKALLLAVLLVFLCTFSSPAAAFTDIELIINHELYTQGATMGVPQLIGDRVYVPLRLVSQSLGYKVDWVEETRAVYIFTDSKSNVPAVGPGDAVAEDHPVRIFIDGALLKTDSFTGMPFITASGRTMIPLRVVSEALNCEVQWYDGVVIVNEILPPVVETPVVTAKPETQTPAETVAGNYAITIQGDSILTAKQLNAYLKAKEPDIRAMMQRNYPEIGFTPFPDRIAELYIDIGKKYNIRGDIAFAQALKETGYFQFYGSVQSFQNNFCGLGASGVANTGEEVLKGVDTSRVFCIPGLHGLSYLTVADGVEAHIQHLYAYTTKDSLPAGCELLDPRFTYVKRGVAERWIDLDGRWAVPGKGYGESILDDYWKPADR